MARALCLHCKMVRAIRRRGLCWGCYDEVSIRDQYGPVSKCGQKGAGHHMLPSPIKPTDALPGSAEKIEVMTARVHNGESPHHPKDARHT